MAGRSEKKANIGEVAKAAGVSKMTVSRTLSHSSKVAPATREKVQKVIDDLEYQPSPFARGLASQKSNILGLMVYAGMNLEYFQPILFGIEHEASINGYDLLIFSRPEDKSKKRSLGLVDGVLCLGYEMDNNFIVDLEKSGIPYAVIGKRKWKNASPWYCAVDYFNGYKNAARMLLETGHRKIAFLGGTSGYPFNIEKYRGYKKARYKNNLFGRKYSRRQNKYRI